MAAKPYLVSSGSSCSSCRGSCRRYSRLKTCATTARFPRKARGAFGLKYSDRMPMALEIAGLEPLGL